MLDWFWRSRRRKKEIIEMAESSNIIEKIPLDQVDQEFKNIRTEYDQNHIRELAESLKRVGLLQPIMVRKEGTKFQIVCGHRRFLAAKYLGWLDIPAIEYSIDDGDADVAKVHENIFRQDLDKIEEAKYYLYLQQKYGYTEKQVSEKINKTQSYVSQHLSILNYGPEIKDAIKYKKVSFSVARELSKVKSIPKRRSLLKAAIENGITARTASIWKKEANEHVVIYPDNHTPRDDDPPAFDPSTIPNTNCQMCDADVKVTEIRSMTMCDVCKNKMVQIREQLKAME